MKLPRFFKKCKTCSKKIPKRNSIPYTNHKNEQCYFCSGECLNEYIKKEEKGRKEERVGFRRIKNLQEIPTLPAVYQFYLDGKCIYIGETKNLDQRIYEHYHNHNALKGKLNSAKKFTEEDLQRMNIYYTKCRNRSKRFKLEKELIQEKKPILNGVNPSKDPEKTKEKKHTMKRLKKKNRELKKRRLKQQRRIQELETRITNYNNTHSQKIPLLKENEGEVPKGYFLADINDKVKALPKPPDYVKPRDKESRKEYAYRLYINTPMTQEEVAHYIARYHPSRETPPHRHTISNWISEIEEGRPK